MIVTGHDDLIGRWVTHRAGGTWVPGRGRCIGLERGGRMRAGTIVEDWNGASCMLHVAGEGRWATDEYLRAVFGYVFGQLGCRCCFGVVSASNAKALRFFERLGFEEVTRLENAHPDGDLVLIRMWRGDCRWVENRLEASDAT